MSSLVGLIEAGGGLGSIQIGEGSQELTAVVQAVGEILTQGNSRGMKARFILTKDLLDLGKWMRRM